MAQKIEEPTIDTLADVVWLVRHGNREDFLDPDWGRTAARPHDPALSPDGVEQARAAGQRLRGEGIGRIFTSPYLRCVQTARAIANSIGAPIHLEPGLGELNNPDWSSGLPVLLEPHELAALTGEIDPTHDALHEPTYPETIDAAFARAAKTARTLAERYDGRLLLVGHAVSIIGIVRTLTGEEGDVPCPLASVFRLEPTLGPWKSTLIADTSHLPEAVAATRFH